MFSKKGSMRIVARMSERSARVAGLSLLTAGLVLSLTATVAAAPKAGGRTLYVSPSGSDSGSCTKQAPCLTIGHAVGLARKNATVMVAAGTYTEDVTIAKRLRVVGVGSPVVDATGLDNGFVINGRGAAGTDLRGFVVENATFEGILAERTSNVRITGNTVQNNDQGGKATVKTGECAPQGQVPGDCGEGLHLMSVTHSHVADNLVQNNAGGILLTDESGPTAFNVISRNRVLNNLLDCGITLAGHNTSAASTTTGKPHPKVGGIYHNTVSRNTANGNGTQGEGAGILIAAAAPGAAAYHNTVIRNTANGNGLAGVTLHGHTPGQDLNANKIVRNRLSNDGLLPGDPDFGVTDTVGILVGSAATKLKGIVISGNRISDVHFGIWTKNVKAINRHSNKFTKVAVPLTQT